MGMNEQKLLVPTDVAEQYQQEIENLTRKEDFIEAAMEKTMKIIDEPFCPRNRAERRAMEKALRAKKKITKRYSDNLREATEKMTYATLIEKVREMRERIEKEGEKENEAATENN